MVKRNNMSDKYPMIDWSKQGTKPVSVTQKDYMAEPTPMIPKPKQVYKPTKPSIAGRINKLVKPKAQSAPIMPTASRLTNN